MSKVAALSADDVDVSATTAISSTQTVVPAQISMSVNGIMADVATFATTMPVLSLVPVAKERCRLTRRLAQEGQTNTVPSTTVDVPRYCINCLPLLHLDLYRI